jgi:hypothetical protein
MTLQAQPSYDYTLKNELPIGNSFVLEINNHDLYYAKGNTLYILDISDPENLTLTKELVLESTPSDIVVSNDKLYIAMDRLGVYCYDVTLSQSPLLLGIYEADYLYLRMEINDNELFLIHNDGLEVVDMTDPQFPELLRYMDMRTMPNAVKKYNDYLLVSTFDEFAIIDIHTPEFPSVVYELDVPFGTDIEVQGNIALVTTMYSIFAIDLSDVFYPRIITQLEDHFQIVNMDSENNKIFGCGQSGFLTVFTQDEGNIHVLNGEKFDAEFRDILVENNYAYVINKKGGLDVFNVADVLNIQKVAHFDEAFYPQIYFIF